MQPVLSMIFERQNQNPIRTFFELIAFSLKPLNKDFCIVRARGVYTVLCEVANILRGQVG